jgi:cytochrome c oxidase cbb3-type subunit 3
VPTKIEKDIVSGRDTTGHDWDGVKELNTPLPNWWVIVFAACVVIAAIQCLLYPSFPGVTGYFHGLLGYSQRTAVDRAVAEVQAQRAEAMNQIATASFEDIRKDPQLMAVAMAAGRIIFADNCQPCHGAGGGGQPGFPALAAGAWIWGGTLPVLQQTITYGIRSGDPKARSSQMLRFGAFGILKPEQIQQVADYVMTLYGKGEDGKDVSAGKAIFAANCAVCHGAEGQGNRTIGAPRLASRVHLYGDARETVVAQVTDPRMGVMPNWNARLNTGQIKAVALYVHALGGGE